MSAAPFRLHNPELQKENQQNSSHPGSYQTCLELTVTTFIFPFSFFLLSLFIFGCFSYFLIFIFAFWPFYEDEFSFSVNNITWTQTETSTLNIERLVLSPTRRLTAEFNWWRLKTHRIRIIGTFYIKREKKRTITVFWIIWYISYINKTLILLFGNFIIWTRI